MKSDKEKVEEILKKLKSKLNESYIEMVDDCAQEDSSLKFKNSSLSHACYITYKMLERAKENVYILSGTLCELYFDTVKDFLRLFAVNLSSIKIITLQEKDSKKIKKLREFFEEINSMSGKKIIEYIPLENKSDPKDFKHFYVVDGKAWRKEKAHDTNHNLQEIHADVCFNDSKEGKELEKAFNSIWNTFATEGAIL